MTLVLTPPPANGPDRENSCPVPVKSVVDDGIRWDRLGQPAFDQMVEALLSRMHDQPGHEIDFIDGRGGDGGRDAVVRIGDQVTIYQFKYYPEGLSISERSRVKSVKASFTAALAHHPARWVLIVPCKMTAAFKKFVFDLGKGKNVTIDYIDRPKLDRLIAPHTDLISLMKQDDLLTERARLLGAQALLFSNGVVDALKHDAANQQALNEMNPYWRVALSEQDGVPTFSFQPKTKNAQQQSPLGVRLAVTHIPTTPDVLGTQLRQAEQFGRPGTVRIPASRLAAFETYGLEWAGLNETGSQVAWVEYHVPSLPTLVDTRVTLRCQDDVKNTLGVFSGRTTGANNGSSGATLIADFYGAVTLTLLMPLPSEPDIVEHLAAPDPPGPLEDTSVTPAVRNAALDKDPAIQGALECEHRWTADPATLAKSTKLRLTLIEAASFEVAVDGHKLVTFGLNRRQTDTPEAEDSDDIASVSDLRILFHTAEDLAFVQQKTSVFFDVPEEISTGERIWLRCFRRMLEGDAVLIPKFSVTGVVRPGAVDAMDTAQDGNSYAIVADLQAPLQVFGQELPVPMVRLYHPRARLDGYQEAAADAQSTDPQGTTFSFTATGNDTLLAFMPELYRGGQTLTGTPWNLSGVEEPTALPGDD